MDSKNKQTRKDEIESSRQTIHFFETLLQATKDGIVITDTTQNIIIVNDAFCSFFGATVRSMIETNLFVWFEQLDDGAGQRWANLEKDLQHKRACSNVEFKLISKHENKWLHVNASLHEHVAGEEKGVIISIWRDVTERKKLQEEVLKARKLESLGVLAGGIAHDFNNLLYMAMGNISLVQDDAELEIKFAENLRAAQEACLKANELSARLMTFSKGGDPVKKLRSINNLLKDVVVSLLSGSNIKPRISIADDIRQAYIDEDQIKQVIENIVVNAREAMDDNGQLTVSCENIDIPEEGYLILNQGNYIRISFIDQGYGISKENLKKIFDPYFSTKDMGINKGQGLGLTISYSIIKKHSGLIKVDSELGTGSIFSIYLPAAISVNESDS